MPCYFSFSIFYLFSAEPCNWYYHIMPPYLPSINERTFSVMYYHIRSSSRQSASLPEVRPGRQSIYTRDPVAPFCPWYFPLYGFRAVSSISANTSWPTLRPASSILNSVLSDKIIVSPSHIKRYYILSHNPCAGNINLPVILLRLP